MGLDQFWKTLNDPTQEYSYENSTELHYHRKVPALEAFFDEMRAGLDQEDCSPVLITEEILDDLEERAIEETLDEDATGFFWGQHSSDDYPDILEAVRKTREALKSGKVVYYRSSW